MSHRNTSDRPLTGGCQCGQLRYKITKSPLTLYCCHCSECQAQSSSAFGMSLRVEAGGVELEGKIATYIRDEGKPTATEGVFCPSCGTRVLHQRKGVRSGVNIKAGSLDERDWLNPVGHIWTKSAQKWMSLDGLTYESQPDDHYQALIDAFSEQQKGR